MLDKWLGKYPESEMAIARYAICKSNDAYALTECATFTSIENSVRQFYQNPENGFVESYSLLEAISKMIVA